MDLSGLSTADLQAVASGDMSKVSTPALHYISGNAKTVDYQGASKPTPAQEVPGMFPYDEEKKIWDASNAQGLDYYQAKQKVLEARNKYTQNRPQDGLGDTLQGASGIVAGTAMAPLGMAQDAFKDAGQAIQNRYPNMAGSMLGGALKYGSNAIPASPKQLVGNETAGAAIGAAMPAVNKGATALGKGLEGLSGLEYKTPGVLREAANDPSLLFGPGKKVAGALYESIKNDLQIRPSMLVATSSGKLIDDAIYALENGDLSPQEALVARRALDDKFGGIPASTANYLRPKFDAIAKTLSAEADAAFKKAIKSEALQGILATNKGGGTSIAKLVLGGFTGGALNVASSPVVQGAAATATGLAGRAIEATPNYLRGAAVSPALRALQKNRDDSNGQ